MELVLAHIKLGPWAIINYRNKPVQVLYPDFYGTTMFQNDFFERLSQSATPCQIREVYLCVK